MVALFALVLGAFGAWFASCTDCARARTHPAAGCLGTRSRKTLLCLLKSCGGTQWEVCSRSSAARMWGGWHGGRQIGACERVAWPFPFVQSSAGGDHAHHEQHSRPLLTTAFQCSPQEPKLTLMQARVLLTLVGFLLWGSAEQGEGQGFDFRPTCFVERHSPRAPAPQRLSRSCGEELVPDVSSGLSFLSPRNLHLKPPLLSQDPSGSSVVQHSLLRGGCSIWVGLRVSLIRKLPFPRPSLSRFSAGC